MSGAITSKKHEQTGELFWDSRYCLSAWVSICVLSPAHESEMRGYLVYLLIVKYLLILFQFSYKPQPYLGILGGFKHFFRGVCGPYYL